MASPPFVRSVFCRPRPSAPADTSLCEVRREPVPLEALLRHPYDPLLELPLAVVKPFSQRSLGDAEEPGGVPRREIVDVAEQDGKPEGIGQRGYDPLHLLPERIGFAPLPLALRFGLRPRPMQDPPLPAPPETALFP